MRTYLPVSHAFAFSQAYGKEKEREDSSVCLPHSASFFPLCFPRHILLLRSRSRLQPVLAIEARHRRILAKSVPPILDALPPFFPIASPQPRGHRCLLLFLLLLLLLLLSLYPVLPYSILLTIGHRIELPFYFRESARYF